MSSTAAPLMEVHRHTEKVNDDQEKAFVHPPSIAVPPPPRNHRSRRLTRFFRSSPLPFMPPPSPLIVPPARILVKAWDRRELASATIRTAPSTTLPRSYQEWLDHARSRTVAYTAAVAVPAVRWVLVRDGDRIPDNFIQTGVEASGEPLYSIRAWFNGGLHVGKGGAHIYRGGSITWGSQEFSVGTFEILVGDSSLLCWVHISGRQMNEGFLGERPPSPLSLEPLASPAALPSLKAPCAIETETAPDPGSHSHWPRLSMPFCAMEGGFEPCSKRGGQSSNPFLPTPPMSPILGRFGWVSSPSFITLFVSQAYYAGGWHAGKVEAGDDHCCIGWGGGEVWVKDFRVLAWAF